MLGNDSDPDATDVLTAAAVRDSGGGTADAWGCSSPTAPAHWWRMNGQRDVYAYDPTGQLDFFAAGESATDTFTYTEDDGNGNTDTAMVTINVTGVNDGPDGGGGRCRRLHGGPRTRPAVNGNVLSNDSDPDATDVLTAAAVRDSTYSAQTVGVQFANVSGALVAHERPTGRLRLRSNRSARFFCGGRERDGYVHLHGGRR